MKDKVIGPGKPKGVSKSPWECRARKGPKKSKWAKDAQRNQKSPNNYTELLREE